MVNEQPLVAFGMKSMLKPFVSLVLSILAGSLWAQMIEFDQGNWSAVEPEHQHRVITIMANEERIDSIYTENIDSGELELVVQRYPLARYEYFPDGALKRRIDIRQESSTQFRRVLVGGDSAEMEKVIKDIPNGAYHEFFPNGNIRIKGTLDGYNADGSLKKTGEWTEWDEHEHVIRKVVYP